MPGGGVPLTIGSQIHVSLLLDSQFHYYLKLSPLPTGIHQKSKSDFMVLVVSMAFGFLVCGLASR